MKMTTHPSPNTTRTARQNRLPRPVVWLALLIALVVAALGAMISQPRPEKASGTARLLSERALAPAG
jgi:hypothetical protein